MVKDSAEIAAGPTMLSAAEIKEKIILGKKCIYKHNLNTYGYIFLVIWISLSLMWLLASLVQTL